LVIVAVIIREDQAIWRNVLGQGLVVHGQLKIDRVEGERDVFVRTGIVDISVPVEVHGEPNLVRVGHSDACPGRAGRIIPCHGKHGGHHLHASPGILLHGNHLVLPIVTLVLQDKGGGNGAEHNQ
jgi:hypothetical protein